MLLLMPLLTFAQLNHAMLSGLLTDDGKKPLPGATVRLFFEQDSTRVKFTVTDQFGKFEFTKAPQGTYLLVITMTGFEPFKSKVALTAEHLDLGNILLKEDVKMLGEVSISASKVVLESKPGMTIYNVANDPMAVGKSLTDVATNLPGISQNGTGALSYGGSNQVVVLVNGRKSNINASDVVQQIQTGNVEKLELITGANPRFASVSGSATINIVLKKNKQQGVNGNAALVANTFGFFNGSFNVNRFSGKTNVYTFLTSDDRFLLMETAYKRINTPNYSLLFAGDIRNQLHHSMRTATIGTDFYLDSLNVITVEHSTSFHSDAMDARTIITKPTDIGITTTTQSAPKEWENTLSVNHQVTMGKGNLMESEISGTLFSLNNSRQYGSGAGREDLSIDNYALRGRSEYTKLVSKNNTMNLGVDYVLIHTDNKSTTFTDSTPNFNNDFTYDNQKAAVYASYLFKASNILSIRPGMRLENAKTNAKGNGFDAVNFDLTTFYPTLNLQWEASKKNVIQLDALRKIQYPDLYSLYTIPNQPDTLNLRRGNAQLLPSIHHEAILEHRYISSKFNLTTRVYGRYIIDFMESYSFSDDKNRMTNVTENVGDALSYGGFLSASFDLAPFWKLRANSNFNFTDVRMTKNIYIATTQLYSFSGAFNNRFIFSKKLDTEIGFRMMNYSRGLSDRYDPMYNLSFQFNYKTQNSKWIIGLLANDILGTMVSRGSIIPNSSVSHDMTFRFRTQYIQVTIKYKFGNLGKNRSKKLEGGNMQFING